MLENVPLPELVQMAEVALPPKLPVNVIGAFEQTELSAPALTVGVGYTITCAC